ncbi:hypothetical protein SAY87_025688 [Trapa incisa]|uniref:C2 domain-containing protein n=1 Tax=Trapa incisa TaxID=236973 RepID=A0AAN7GI69_9MYRT|nr:hypothetical protein SAY87_025688 [Trapa incisa]
MEDTAASSLDLKILDGKDIAGFNFFQKLSVYAAASISSSDPERKLDGAQQQRTQADKEGDGCPEWNHELRLDLKGIDLWGSDDVFLRIDLFHEGAMFGDKHLGEVRVPIGHLIEHAAGVVRFVSYQVKGVDGKPNGVLRFSYRVNGVGKDTGIEAIGSTIYHHHHHQEDQGTPAIGYPSPATTFYPSLENDTAPSAPPLETPYPPPEAYYSLPPEGFYHPPPPPTPPVVQASSPGMQGAWHYYHHGPPRPPPPGQPMYHHHHQHQHSWGHGHHGPYMGGGGWGPY